MDIIFVNDLKIQTIIGIYDWERETKQTISLDLEMASDIRKAAETDDIANTLDYKAVSKRLIGFVESSDYFLVERLAEECAQIILNEFDVPWVRLKLNKGEAVRGASGVGILIERGVKPVTI